MAKKRAFKSPQKLWEDVSSLLVHFVEGIFFRLGVAVGRNPWRTIIITWLFVLLSAIGLLKLHMEKNPLKLWVPPESDFLRDTNWYIDTFGTGIRLQKVLITADNVLKPEIIQLVSDISNQVNSISISYNDTHYGVKDLCFQVPVINLMNSNQKNTSEVIESKKPDYTDPTLWLDYSFYCSFLENFPYTCLQENIVDIWKNDQEIMVNLTEDDIMSQVQMTRVNPVNGHPFNYSKMLGGVKYDDNGNLKSAESVLLVWYNHVDMKNVDLNEVGNLVGTEEWVTVPLALWEGQFLELMEKLSNDLKSVNIYYESGRSFGDISGQTMFHEMDKLFIGIALMFLYIQLALSRFNWLEVRMTLGGIGLMCVGMAYCAAISWCSVFGIPFGPVHASLPFLLMGLGVDDMFVMKACWEQLTADELKKSLPHKVGLMLKHAGVSIVITSFTDIVALLIGAVTVLPSLQSFCFYAAAGVFFIFCFTTTYYVAVFTLDVRRIEDNRNGFLFCYKHKRPVTTSKHTPWFQSLFNDFYKKVVFTTPCKIFVLVFTVAMTGYSILGVLKLEQRFDPMWFIPEGTYYKDYLNMHQHYYPNEGYSAMVFLGEMDYSKEFPNLYNMVHELENQTYVNHMDRSWLESFRGYVLANHQLDLLNSSSIASEDFHFHLSQFLFSPVGGRYQLNFKFSEPLRCGATAPRVLASSIPFQFPRFSGPAEYLPAMNGAKGIVKSTEVASGDGYRSVWSKAFGNWVTDEVIAVEVERNIELALLCVMLCTAVLITNLQMCFWIFLCVLLTIVNVLGWMQRWGMTVDIVCCIGLELAIGLCVDYAAHVGHTFLTLGEGSRAARAERTVASIGTAVLLGGGSTLLSLSLLSMSNAYTFQSFFKIFLLVILFGLFNGLVFLPTVLSLIGPAAYKRKSTGTAETVELNGKENVNDDEKSQFA